MNRNYKFTKFERHVDNARETIQAEDTNLIQKAVNDTEVSIVELYDKEFEQKVLFEFDNSIYANSVFIDKVLDLNFININKSIGIEFNTSETCIQLKSGREKGMFLTNMISGEFGTVLDDFKIISELMIPKGSSLEFYISSDYVRFYPITPNTNEPPLHLGKNRGTHFCLKVVLRANIQMESPKMYGYSVMFFDEMLDHTYGMVNPDLRRFTEEDSSSVHLVRDRALNDKLVRVVESGSITELHYNLDDEKLSYIISNDGVNISKTNMEYGNYLNSKGKVENVLLGVTQEPMSLEDSVPDKYKFVSEEGGS